MIAVSSYILGTITLTGALMGYIKKGSVPSLLAGGLVAVIYFIGGALTTQNRRAGLLVSLGASSVLLIAGLVRAAATQFQKAVPLVLSALGLASTLYYGSYLVY
ncbi:hypothetical protein CANINC_002712 [Pichia inconspicua]|uniref:Uncharacterized protein n=1 Tax=Pichia inconspicua TaxID=52247 RepID=A0A4T0X0G6_9ASCO|nr:hypothetical protein CANINC_002712 [[Candida] inconspicua]